MNLPEIAELGRRKARIAWDLARRNGSEVPDQIPPAQLSSFLPSDERLANRAYRQELQILVVLAQQPGCLALRKSGERGRCKPRAGDGWCAYCGRPVL